MLSFVEKFICATFFSYAHFRILTSPLSNILKTVFKKSHAEGLGASSFAWLCLRTHPQLTFSMRSKCNLLLFFSKIIWVNKTHDTEKDALVTTGKFSIKFCSNQSNTSFKVSTRLVTIFTGEIAPAEILVFVSFC